MYHVISTLAKLGVRTFCVERVFSAGKCDSDRQALAAASGFSSCCMDDEERRYFLRAKTAFINYVETTIHSEVTRREMEISNLSGKASEFAEAHLRPHLDAVHQAVLNNGVITKIVAASASSFLTDATGTDEPTELDETKVASTLRQLAREWSLDGAEERSQSFEPILSYLDEFFPPATRRNVKILVPGSGLGRLPFELSLMGFEAIGNEVSTHMLLASDAILNVSPGANSWTIYPYVNNFSHWRTDEDQVRPVMIPDVGPAECEQLGSMSMFIGEIKDICRAQATSDRMQAVATCFFIDAPLNFFDTLEAITEVVEPGGIWVNFGPLHWHSESAGGGLELPLESVIMAVEKSGWRILTLNSNRTASYCSTHPARMAKLLFECVFWVAQRVIPPESP